MAENSSMAILLTDSHIELPGPHIKYLNKNFERMTGYSLEDLYDKTPRVLQGVKTSRKTLDELRKCLKEEREFKGAAINYKKDGSEFLMSWCVSACYLDGIKYFYAVQTDVKDGLLLVLDEIKRMQSHILTTIDRQLMPNV